MNPEFIEHTACFTGHRPEKLHADSSDIKEALETEIDNAISKGYTTFISGMARGVDLWAADIVLHKGMRLIAAVPFEGYEIADQEFGWLFRDVMEKADEIHVCSGPASKLSFINRDRWMVDNSSLVIAVFHGENGGTAQTVSYAKTRHVPVVFCG